MVRPILTTVHVARKMGLNPTESTVVRCTVKTPGVGGKMDVDYCLALVEMQLPKYLCRTVILNSSNRQNFASFEAIVLMI